MLAKDKGRVKVKRETSSRKTTSLLIHLSLRVTALWSRVRPPGSYAASERDSADKAGQERRWMGNPRKSIPLSPRSPSGCRGNVLRYLVILYSE